MARRRLRDTYARVISASSAPIDPSALTVPVIPLTSLPDKLPIPGVNPSDHSEEAMTDYYLQYALAYEQAEKVRRAPSPPRDTDAAIDRVIAARTTPDEGSSDSSPTTPTADAAPLAPSTHTPHVTTPLESELIASGKAAGHPTTLLHFHPSTTDWTIKTRQPLAAEQRNFLFQIADGDAVTPQAKRASIAHDHGIIGMSYLAALKLMLRGFNNIDINAAIMEAQTQFLREIRRTAEAGAFAPKQSLAGLLHGFIYPVLAQVTHLTPTQAKKALETARQLIPLYMPPTDFATVHRLSDESTIVELDHAQESFTRNYKPGEIDAFAKECHLPATLFKHLAAEVQAGGHLPTQARDIFPGPRNQVSTVLMATPNTGGEPVCIYRGRHSGTPAHTGTGSKQDRLEHTKDTVRELALNASTGTVVIISLVAPHRSAKPGSGKESSVWHQIKESCAYWSGEKHVTLGSKMVTIHAANLSLHGDRLFFGLGAELGGLRDVITKIQTWVDNHADLQNDWRFKALKTVLAEFERFRTMSRFNACNPNLHLATMANLIAFYYNEFQTNAYDKVTIIPGCMSGKDRLGLVKLLTAAYASALWDSKGTKPTQANVDRYVVRYAHDGHIQTAAGNAGGSLGCRGIKLSPALLPVHWEKPRSALNRFGCFFGVLLGGVLGIALAPLYIIPKVRTVASIPLSLAAYCWTRLFAPRARNCLDIKSELTNPAAKYNHKGPKKDKAASTRYRGLVDDAVITINHLKETAATVTAAPVARHAASTRVVVVTNPSAAASTAATAASSSDDHRGSLRRPRPAVYTLRR